MQLRRRCNTNHARKTLALLLEYNKGDVANLKALRERSTTQESANGGVNFR